MASQGYFISPGGHLRSSQNDLDLPSDPIECGSSTPDVERSSTTMTRRGIYRERELDGKAHDSGDDLYSEVPSIGEAMAALSYADKTEHPILPSSPPLRPVRVTKKRRPSSIYVDGPNSTPSGGPNRDNHAEQPQNELVDNKDNNDNNDATSTLPEPEGDDDYEVPASDTGSDDSLISEVKRPRGKGKPPAARSRTTRRKSRAATKKTSGKVIEKKSEPKKIPTTSRSITTSNRLKGSKGSSKNEQAGKTRAASASPLARRAEYAPSNIIPGSQPIQTNPRHKSIGQTARVAKKPFYDESTGSQRKHSQPTESSSSGEPGKENQAAAEKKRPVPRGKQSGHKRSKLNDDSEPNIGASGATGPTTKPGQRPFSNSEKNVEEGIIGPTITVDSTSKPLDDEQDPWEISTTPMNTKAPNNVHGVHKSEHEVQRPSQASSKNRNNTKRSPVQYGLRARNPKRVIQRVSKVKNIGVEKNYPLEIESDSQNSEPRLLSTPHPSSRRPPSSPRAKTTESLHRQIPDPAENPPKTSDDGSPGGRHAFNLLSPTKKESESPIIVSTDRSSEPSMLEDEGLELPIAPMSPSYTVSQRPPLPKETVSRVIGHTNSGATSQPIRNHDGSHSQTLTIQGHSPITSPRDCLESQEIEMDDVLRYHPGHCSKNKPLESNTLGNVIKKAGNSPVNQARAPKMKLLGNARSFQPRHREANIENQLSEVRIYTDETETRNKFPSYEHETHIPRKDVTILQSKPAIQGFPGHSVVTPLGSPHATLPRVGFTRHVEEGPMYNQLQGRSQHQRRGDPFRPSPPEIERTDTRALHLHPKEQSSSNSQDVGQENIPRHGRFILTDRNPFQEPDAGVSRSLQGSQNYSSATNMGHRGEEVPRHPLTEPVQFHPKSVTFASRASQAFQCVEGRLPPGEKANIEHMNESVFIPSQQPTLKKNDRFLIPLATGNINSKVKQPSKWEQAVDVACSGVADTMHHISVKILEHLRTREENLEIVLSEYKRNGTKITGKLAARQDTEQLSAAREFRQACLETADLYKEASRNIHMMQERSQVHERGDGITQWKRQTERVEQAIQTFRRELNSL